MRKYIFVILIFPSIVFSQKEYFYCLPTIKYDKTQGMYFRITATYLNDDTIFNKVKDIHFISLSPVYTTKGNWGIKFANKSFILKDRFRWTTLFGYTDYKSRLDFDQEALLSDYGNYNQENLYIFLETQLKIIKYASFGLRYELNNTKLLPDSFSNITVNKHSRYLGVFYNYDSNKEYFYRTHGLYINANLQNYYKFLNNDDVFGQYELILNYYKTLPKFKTILANRVVTKVLTGNNAPFYKYYVVGGIDLRGYSKQAYSAKQLYALQSELRTYFNDNMGVVLFGGAALSVNSLNEVSFDRLFPSIGTGFRLKLASNQLLFYGVDVAVGKKDWGFYLRIGDAF